MEKFEILSEIISRRKAIRNYAEKEINVSFIRKIIEVATRVPSWHGLEP